MSKGRLEQPMELLHKQNTTTHILERISVRKILYTILLIKRKVAQRKAQFITCHTWYFL